MAKKIYLGKTDSLASVVGKIVKSKEEDIVLYVPRNTEFAGSRTNFILLKREVTTAGKTLSIESVDEDVLELADTAGIKATNPFLHRRQKAVSDIVAIRPREDVRPLSQKEITKDEAEGEEPVPPPAALLKKRISLPKWQRREKPEIAGRGEATPRRFIKSIVVTGIVAAVFVGLMITLPRAKITLNMEKKNLEFIGTMVTSAAIKENGFSQNQVLVRGANFVEKRNVTKSYPASGKKYVERKAAGEVVIYNNFSSAPQNLVATTRFVTPDGKIYRLNNSITVPGATTSGGKLTPSSITALVTADKAGEEYNLSSGVKFRIPGFQGSAKYDGFYAENKGTISGGFVGESNLPSEADLKSAEEDVKKALEDAVKTQLLFDLPPEVKVLSNAYEFKVTETKINDAANEAGKFSITAFGEARLVAFREPELVQVIGKGLIGKSADAFKVENDELEYGEAKLDADGTLTVPVKFKSVWTRIFDTQHFKNEVAGKKQAELQNLVFSIPGIQSGEARLWPFWVTRVPKDTNRILVDVK